MSFKNYLQTRKPNAFITWDFIIDARDDNSMPNIESWGELKDYLRSISACEGAFEAANLVWRCYQMQKNKGKIFLEKECALIRKEFEEQQKKLDEWRPPTPTFYCRGGFISPGCISEVIMGLIVRDQQSNSFAGPNGFPAVEADYYMDGYRVVIYTRFAEAPPIFFPGVTADRLLRENYKKAITPENFPDLYKAVVDRICFLEQASTKKPAFKFGR